MSYTYASNDAFFRDLRVVVEAWCDRRCLHALAIILPAFTSFNGMTDGWGELISALKIVSLSSDALTDREREIVAQLRAEAEAAVHGR